MNNSLNTSNDSIGSNKSKKNRTSRRLIREKITQINPFFNVLMERIQELPPSWMGSGRTSEIKRLVK